jgi:hypothetical protein
VTSWHRKAGSALIVLWLFTVPNRTEAGGLFQPGGLSLDLGGYYKDLFTRSQTFFSKETVVNDLKRYRLEGEADLGGILRLEVTFDNEWYIGSLVNTPDFSFGRQLQRPFFIDATWEVADEKSFFWQATLFRGFVQIYTPLADITIGRQRVAWGTGFVWNPTDLLNPFIPIQLERDERQGVDAVRFELPLGITSKLDLVFAPQRKGRRSSTAARVRTTVANYDVSLMAGRFRDNTVLGFDWSGDIRGGGFRGEGAYTRSGQGKDYFRFVLSGDYTFSNGLYLFGEFFYNGQGARRKEEYDFNLLLSGEAVGLAQLYLALGASYDFTPLWHGDFYGIFNMNDGSRLVGPALSYSLTDNVDLAAGVYFFGGEDGSELGSLTSIYFGQFQWFF